MSDDVASMGGLVLTGTDVVGISSASSRVTITTRDGGTITAGSAVICAGLESDRLAHKAGDAEYPVIVPFRGEYMQLVGSSQGLVNGLIYPLPDPHYPFLGVHFTPTVHREVLVGPNAVPALARYGYRWREHRRQVCCRALATAGRVPTCGQTLAPRVHRSMAVLEPSSLRSGAAEVRAIDSARRSSADEGRVRAQAVGRKGDLISDFVITRCRPCGGRSQRPLAGGHCRLGAGARRSSPGFLGRFFRPEPGPASALPRCRHLLAQLAQMTIVDPAITATIPNMRRQVQRSIAVPTMKGAASTTTGVATCCSVTTTLTSTRSSAVHCAAMATATRIPPTKIQRWTSRGRACGGRCSSRGQHDGVEHCCRGKADGDTNHRTWQTLETPPDEQRAGTPRQ